MSARSAISLVLSLIAVWLASSAMDWRYLPWGTITATPVFVLGILGATAGGFLVALNISRLATSTPPLVAHAAAVIVCLVLEFLFWTWGPQDHAVFARQGAGLVAAVLPLGIAAILARRTAPRSATSRVAISYAVGAILLGAALFAALFAYRQAPFSATGVYGPEYEMLQSMLFGILATTFVGVVAAIAGRGSRAK